MKTDITRTLARPRHIFDLPAFAVWTLAAIGTVALAIAHALDDVVARRNARSLERAWRPRSRPGPEPPPTPAEHGVPDAWRIR